MENYGRRGYRVETEEGSPEPKVVDIVVRVDGKDFARLVLTNPGLVAVIRKPNTTGFTIEVVRSDGVRYTDVPTPEAVDQQMLTDWQRAALLEDAE